MAIVLIVDRRLPRASPRTSRSRSRSSSSAVFQNAPPIQKGTAVRIAGVDVGKVSKVEALGGDSPGVKVTMKLEDEALPIHEDAEVKARERIFLEGNLFLDIKPGSPSADTVDDGDTIPASQTAAPVQFDQVLGTLTGQHAQGPAGPARGLRRRAQRPAGARRGRRPGPGRPGRDGGQALNKSLDYAADALRGTAIVNQALLGRSATTCRS